MSSDLSLYLGNKIARWLGGEVMPTAPTDIWIALFDGDPKAAGTEVTTDVRAAGRVAATWDVPISGTGNVLTTDDVVDFGDSDGGADITHVAAYDASTSGNLLASKALSSPVTVILATPVSFDTGDITFTIGS